MCVARSEVPCREKRVRAEVEEWEEPLHPGPVSAFYPTFPHNATQLAHFLPRMSTDRPLALPPERAEKQGFRRVGDRGAIRGEPVQDDVPIAVLHASLPLWRPLPSGACASVGRGGIPVHRPAPATGPSPTMRGDEDHAPARPDPGARPERRDRRRLRLVQRQRRRRRSRRADPGRRARLRRGRRPPRRQGPQRPRGRAEEDPAHRRPGREDPAAARRQRQGRRRHLQGRRRAVARRPRRRRRHRAAQRPERRLRRRSSPPRTTARPSKLLAKQKGDIVKRSYKGVDYRFDRKEKTATALIDHRVVVGTEGGLKAVVDAKGKDHARPRPTA